MLQGFLKNIQWNAASFKQEVFDFDPLQLSF